MYALGHALHGSLSAACSTWQRVGATPLSWSPVQHAHAPSPVAQCDCLVALSASWPCVRAGIQPAVQTPYTDVLHTHAPTCLTSAVDAQLACQQRRLGAQQVQPVVNLCQWLLLAAAGLPHIPAAVCSLQVTCRGSFVCCCILPWPLLQLGTLASWYACTGSYPPAV
jgi:hypothetical protein